jgi:hypothetical protein
VDRKPPEMYRDDADEVLVAAAAAGLGLEELAGLFEQMYERARGACRMKIRTATSPTAVSSWRPRSVAPG